MRGFLILLGLLLVVGGGTSHGVAMAAPTPAASLRQRAIAAGTGALEATGRSRSPFQWGDKLLWFAEPPHMQVSMLWLPESVLREGLANGLQTYSSLSTKVSGHTDSTGDAQLNDKLSEARANATINRLVSLGVPATRLLAEGKGQREPIASNDSAEGRAANRRVDLLIIDLPQ